MVTRALRAPSMGVHNYSYWMTLLAAQTELLDEHLHALQMTGRELDCQYFGKPNRAPYELAERLLYDQAVELGLFNRQQASADNPAAAFGAIYAVGDNPRADIAGARAQGAPWVSMLVRTGVFSGDDKNDKEHPADVVVDDVYGAVEAALHRTRSMRWHSMR